MTTGRSRVPDVGIDQSRYLLHPRQAHRCRTDGEEEPHATAQITDEAFELRPDGELRRLYRAYNDNTINSVSFRVRVRVFNQGISTAALRKAARTIDITVSRQKPGRR